MCTRSARTAVLTDRSICPSCNLLAFLQVELCPGRFGRVARSGPPQLRLQSNILNVEHDGLPPSEGLLIDGGDCPAHVLLFRMASQDHDWNRFTPFLLHDGGDADVLIA